MGKMYTLRVSDQHMSTIIRQLAEMPYRDSAPIINALAAQMNEQNRAVAEQVKRLADEEARQEVLDQEAAEEAAF